MLSGAEAWGARWGGLQRAGGQAVGLSSLRSTAKSEGLASFCLFPRAEIDLGEDVCCVSQI